MLGSLYPMICCASPKNGYVKAGLNDSLKTGSFAPSFEGRVRLISKHSLASFMSAELSAWPWVSQSLVQLTVVEVDVHDGQ